MSRLHTPLRRALAGVAVLVTCAAAGLALTAWLGGEDSTSRPAAVGSSFPAPPSHRGGEDHFSPAAAQAGLGRTSSVIARARGRTVIAYPRPGGHGRGRRILGRTVGRAPVPLVFLVRARRPGWLRVELPVRPNLSTGWVRARDVRLSQTEYRIVVELRHHWLTVWEGRRRIDREPIATGRALSPTPTGRYYVTDLLRPPDPRGFYGPYAFGLSAHSPIYTSFAGGDGQVGIHGTNNPRVLGTDVSHGCIRISNQAITRLARRLPLGTPVVIRR